MEPHFYLGCPMWGYKAWVGTDFFPAKTPASDFLRLYSRRLTCVEGNTTFYALPSEETVARWVALDGCTDKSTVAQNSRDLDSGLAGSETTVISYRDGCANGSRVELWRIDGGHHVPQLSAAFTPALLDFLYASVGP